MANEKVISEGDLKLAVSEYLEYGTNQGRWYADRLNSGAVTLARGYAKYKIQLCREGTSDFMVIQAVYFEPKPRAVIPKLKSCRVIYIEVKSPKGKQRPEQGAFQKLVEAQGAHYFVIRSIEELEEVLK